MGRSNYTATCLHVRASRLLLPWCAIEWKNVASDLASRHARRLCNIVASCLVVRPAQLPSWNVIGLENKEYWADVGTIAICFSWQHITIQVFAVKYYHLSKHPSNIPYSNFVQKYAEYKMCIVIMQHNFSRSLHLPNYNNICILRVGIKFATSYISMAKMIVLAIFHMQITMEKNYLHCRSSIHFWNVKHYMNLFVTPWPA